MTASSNPVPDEELRRHLERRIVAGPLSSEDRADILRDVRLVSTSNRRGRSWVPRLAASFVAVALVVFAVVGSRFLPVPVQATPEPTNAAVSSALASPGPSDPLPSEDPGSLHIYTAQQLSDMVGDPNWIGRAVLAEALIGQMTTAPLGGCDPPTPCESGVLEGVDGKNVVGLSWRDTPASSGRYHEGRWLELVSYLDGGRLYAFRVAREYVELLGPVTLTEEGKPWLVNKVGVNAPGGARDEVFPVTGWLVQTPPIPCPPPGPDELSRSPKPASDWYCGGTRITATEEAARPPHDALIRNGLQAQHGAYDEFAVDPAYGDDNWAVPRLGTYLVRNAGCPPWVMGECPVWRILGRLSNDVSYEPTPTPDPTPTVPPPADTPSPLTSSVLRIGDRVRATGEVLGTGPDGLRICEPQPTILTPMPLNCPEAMSVAIRGIRADDLPGWKADRDGNGYSRYLELVGTWTGEEIVVDDAREIERPSRSRLQVPCPAPASGWPGPLPQTLEGEDTARMISEIVEGDPYEYGGLWSGLIDARNPDSERAMVVWVFGDPEDVRAVLENAYPYNLCLTKAKYPKSYIERVESELGPATVAWRPNWWPQDNQVTVEFPFVTEEIAARVARYGDAVVLDPLVEVIEAN